MSSNSRIDVDKFALVSSFYGPGAVGGWYLTACACLVSLALHPRKQCHDSITADIIAVVAFPTIAAAHLIKQTRAGPENTTESQHASNLEASLVLIEAFMAIDVLYLLFAVGFKCIKRGCLFAAMGIFCFGAECNVFFRPSLRLSILGRFDRMFMMSFKTIVIGQLTLLVATLFLTVGVTVLFFMFSRSPVREPNENGEASSLEGKQRRSILESSRTTIITLITAFYLHYVSAATLTAMFISIIDVQTTASDLVTAVIPRSNSSIKELDQAVALFAGASVLGFSVYGTAKTYYQISSRSPSDHHQDNMEFRTRRRVWPSTLTDPAS